MYLPPLHRAVSTVNWGRNSKRQEVGGFEDLLKDKHCNARLHKNDLRWGVVGRIFKGDLRSSDVWKSLNMTNRLQR